MEIWKDIIGYEGLYQVSNLGRVKSLSRGVPGKMGSIRIVKEKLMSTSIDCDGYVRYNLLKDGKIKHFKRGALMARHFIPNPDNLPLARHLNDINTDDRLENLAWGTWKQNTHDALLNGKIPTGEKHWSFGKKTIVKETAKQKLIEIGGRVSNIVGCLLLDTKTGIYYETIKEAAFIKNMNAGTLRCQVSGKNPNKTSLIKV